MVAMAMKVFAFILFFGGRTVGWDIQHRGAVPEKPTSERALRG
jgi:hypothetical protein